MVSCGAAYDVSPCQRPNDTGNAVEDVLERFSASRDSDPSKAAEGGDLAHCNKCGEKPKAGTHRVFHRMCVACFRSYLYGNVRSKTPGESRDDEKPRWSTLEEFQSRNLGGRVTGS